MIELDHLVTLRSIARTGSISGAAAELSFTPSAISQQVKRLERHLGGRVLDRVGRGVTLTERGRQLVDESGDILTRVEALQARLGSLGDGPLTGKVRLAAFSTSIRGLAAPALRRLRTQAPGIEVSLLEVDPHDAIDLVADGGADAALVHNWGQLPLPFPDHVEVAELGVDLADVLLPRSHPLAGADSVTPTDLADQEWVCAPQGSVCHGWLTHMYATAGLRPNIRHWAMEFSSHIGLVSEGVCISLVPRLGREPLPDSIVAVPLKDPVPTRRVMMTWRRSMAPSPVIAAVRSALAAECAQRLADSSPGLP